MGNRNWRRGSRQETHPNMKLPVSDTKTNSSSERCCAAMKGQPRRMIQPETYGVAHHQLGCSWLGVVGVIYRY